MTVLVAKQTTQICEYSHPMACFLLFKRSTAMLSIIKKGHFINNKVAFKKRFDSFFKLDDAISETKQRNIAIRKLQIKLRLAR